MESNIYFVSTGFIQSTSSFFFDFSNLRKHDDELHLHVYDDDVVGRDSVGSAKIDLKKHVFGKGRYDSWVKLPAMLGLSSKGEIHVIIEHHVINLSFFFIFQV